MSSAKLVVIFYIFIIELQVFVSQHQVSSFPISNSLINVTNSRNPRFLGKLSIVAGLNLPGQSVPQPSISRNDLLYERVPNQVSFNYPTTRWGPYVAAIYEPLPFVSFFNNPFGFLASALNPFNWFGGTTTSNPVTTTAPVSVKDHDDVVLLIDDSKNEIPNEDRAIDKPIVKFTKDIFTKGNNKFKKPAVVTSTTPSYTRQDDFVTTVEDSEEAITDLAAAETTHDLIERIKNITREAEYNSRQGTTRRTTISPTAMTTANVTTSSPGNLPSNLTTTTTTTTTSSGTGNNTIVTIAPTQNTTFSSSSSRPTQRPTYPSYWNGYYYGGSPQNVSHLEFTVSPSLNQVPQQISFEQQLPTLDYFSRFDNLLTDAGNNYHADERQNTEQRESEDSWYPNGFKPSLNFRF